MRNIKIGIVGCGGIAQNKHLPAIAKMKNIEVVAFCDIIEERAIKCAKKYGTADATVYTDYKELLKNKDIEAVHVLTPNREHSMVTIAALEANLHVMCEKPMAKTYAEAKAMCEAAEKSGKVLSIGYQNRCNPESLMLKQVCENGELGEIYYAKAHAIRRRAVPTWGVFLDEEAQGGGPLIDIGTHALDLTLWMMDNYKPKMVVGNIYKKLGDQRNTANAWGDWDIEKFTVEDSAFGFITMENGATIVLESSWALNTLDVKEAKTTLCGTLAGADMEDDKLRINGVAYGNKYTKETEFEAGGVAFFDGEEDMEASDIECRNFYDAVINGAELRVKPRQALVVTQILEAIYKSAETGTAVYFND